MFDQLKNNLAFNYAMLPFQLFYCPFGAIRSLSYATNQLILENLGHYFYSPEQLDLTLKKTKFNLIFARSINSQWQQRFIFREFLVTPLLNIPQDYETFQQAIVLRGDVLNNLKKDIENETGKPVVEHPCFGYIPPKKSGLGNCKVISESLAQAIMKDASHFLKKIDEYRLGSSAELTAKQLFFNEFTNLYANIEGASISKAFFGIEAVSLAIIGGYSSMPYELDSLICDSETYLINFQAVNLTRHQILLHCNETSTVIVDSNIGVLLCEKGRRIELLWKVIEIYPYKEKIKREITIQKVQLIDPNENRWLLNRYGFEQYVFKKKEKID